ncbi:MAG: radical SAM protein [Elusimicrobiales bacterium]|nr:radical SAM protein [Elusimicrobiales bacterium]
MTPSRLPPTLELYFTNRCNLDCAYCSSRPVKAGGTRTMSLEEIVRGAELALDYSRRAGGGPLTVGLTGGEPLLEFPLLRRAVEKLRRRRGLVLHVCTNGTLLDRDKAAFLLDNGVELDVSLDGPAVLHDRNRRPGPGGPPSVFSAVMRNLEKLPASWLGRMRAVSTFDSRTVGGAAGALDFLRGLGFRSAGFGLDIYEIWPRRRLENLAAALAVFRRGYVAAWLDALRAPRRPLPLFPFEDGLGADQASLVSNEFSLSVDGYFFPSDTVCRGAGRPGWTVGDLRTGLDSALLARTRKKVSQIIGRYGFPNGIIPAADRYWHEVFRGADPGPSLANAREVSEVFERELGGLLWARRALAAMATEPGFGDIAHPPRHAAPRGVPSFYSAGGGLSGSRKTLDYCIHSPARSGRLELEAGGTAGFRGKLALYALLKAAQLGRSLKLSLRR